MKSFLFLQGPPGPFFARLGRELVGRGHKVLRVNLTGGDSHDWQGPSLDYSGWPEGFGEYIAAIAAEAEITDLVLWRPASSMHAIALHLLADRVRCHVFDEPLYGTDCVALYQVDTSGRPLLKRTKDAITLASAANEGIPTIVTPKKAAPVDRGSARFDRFVWGCATHLSRKAYPGWVPDDGLEEPTRLGLALDRMLNESNIERESRLAVQTVVTCGWPFYTLFLPASDDLAAWRTSPFSSYEALANYVCASFAKHAPDTTLLLVIDGGGLDWREKKQAVAHVAGRNGVGWRVVWGGSIEAERLVSKTAGTIVVRGRPGAAAINALRPTIVLGDAPYDMDGLTYANTLHMFWKDRTLPEEVLAGAFRNAYENGVQISGSFHGALGLSKLVPRALSALLMEGQDETRTLLFGAPEVRVRVEATPIDDTVDTPA